MPGRPINSRARACPAAPCPSTGPGTARGGWRAAPVIVLWLLPPAPGTASPAGIARPAPPSPRARPLLVVPRARPPGGRPVGARRVPIGHRSATATARCDDGAAGSPPPAGWWKDQRPRARGVNSGRETGGSGITWAGRALARGDDAGRTAMDGPLSTAAHFGQSNDRRVVLTRLCTGRFRSQSFHG